MSHKKKTPVVMLSTTNQTICCEFAVQQNHSKSNQSSSSPRIGLPTTLKLSYWVGPMWNFQRLIWSYLGESGPLILLAQLRSPALRASSDHIFAFYSKWKVKMRPFYVFFAVNWKHRKTDGVKVHSHRMQYSMQSTKSNAPHPVWTNL